MKTNQFFDILENNAGKNLHFELPDGERLGGDLHITEVKRVEVKSVDCGGRSSRFNETHTQLWVNEASEKEAAWTTDKALKIYHKVQQVQDYDDEAEAFIEYGDSRRPAMKYIIDDMRADAEALVIKMNVSRTMCKPREERKDTLAAVCC